MAGYVERGDMPGIVTLVSRRGEVHVEAIGNKAVGSSDPMLRDTIFRIPLIHNPGERWMYRVPGGRVGCFDCACIRPIARDFPVRTHLQSAQDEGHSLQCAG
jgi:hypothetical protein